MANTTVRLTPPKETYSPDVHRQAYRTIEDAFNANPQPSLPTVVPYAATVNIRPVVVGPQAIITLTGAITVNLDSTGLLPGSPFRLTLIQDGVGGRVTTWGTGPIRWGTGGAPALTTTLSTLTIVDFHYDSVGFDGKLYGTGYI
jgi:hypothetical protein